MNISIVIIIIRLFSYNKMDGLLLEIEWQQVSSIFRSLLSVLNGFTKFLDRFNLVIIIIIYSLEFFTSALSDGFWLEFEWLQVTSSLQGSSQYSGRYQ